MEKGVAVNTKRVHVLDARARVPKERVVLLLGHGQVTVPESEERVEGWLIPILSTKVGTVCCCTKY